MEFLELYHNKMPLRLWRVLELIAGGLIASQVVSVFLAGVFTGITDLIAPLLALSLIISGLSKKQVVRMEWNIPQRQLWVTTVSLFGKDEKYWEADLLNTRLLKPEKKRPLEFRSRIRWKVLQGEEEIAEIKPSLLVSKNQVKSGYNELKEVLKT